MDRKVDNFHILISLLLLIAMPVSTWIVLSNDHALLAWYFNLVLLLAVVMVAGRGVTGLWKGVWVCSLNVLSLSRLQITLWTILISATLFTAIMWNIVSGQPAPMNIGIPTELWTLMAISTASMVLSPLVLGEKGNLPADPAATAKAQADLKDQGQDPSNIKPKGLLMANAKPDLARWSDLFTGDEMSNGLYVDLAKLQMLLFTMVVLAAYGLVIRAMFAGAGEDGITEFPAIKDTLVTLIGISHAGYISNKAVKK